MIERRKFIALLSASAVLPNVALGQRLQRKLCVVLAIKSSAEYQSALEAFHQTLASLGWKRDDNLRVDQFWSAGDQGHEHALAVAKNVLALNPDVILAQSAAVVSALRSGTQSIPIVFVHVADPVSSGFVSNIARPNGNITGVTNTVPSLGGKGAIAGLVGIEVGVVSGVFNLESPGVDAPGWRPRHDKR